MCRCAYVQVCLCASVLRPRIENMKAAVSERALIARINRRLRPNFEAVRRCRPDSHAYGDLGDYYVVDTNRNALGRHRMDRAELETYGRAIGCLKQWEKLAEQP
jgi:hypothetical protein